MPPQFIGPKLLTALHNIVNFPVMEEAAVLSPIVIRDILMGGGEAMTFFIKNSNVEFAGANLCISSLNKNEIAENEMNKLIEVLLARGN